MTELSFKVAAGKEWQNISTFGDVWFTDFRQPSISLPSIKNNASICSS